jgi:hypothetical protein
VSDFVTGLREDLMEAAAREQARTRPRPARRRVVLPRPGVLLGALAVVAVVAALAVLLSTVAPHDAAQPAAPKVVQRIDIGGQPQSAVFASGALWVVDVAGQVRRVDPVTGEAAQVARFRDVGFAIAAGHGQLWALGGFRSAANRGHYELLRIDPRSGKVVARLSGIGDPSGLAVGKTGVWVAGSRCRCKGGTDHHPSLIRRDPATGAVTADVRMPSGGDAAAGGGTVWFLGQDGSLMAVDEASDRVVRRLPGLATLGADGASVMRADDDGVLVADGAGDRLLRVTTQGITRRVPTGPNPARFTVSGKSVWVVTGDRIGGAKQLLTRLDVASGKVTGTVDLGRVLVQSVVAASGGVWIVEEGGRLVRVRG